MDTPSSETTKSPAVRRFEELPPLRQELEAVLRLLPLRHLPGLTCLDIGFPTPEISRRLRARGGAWRTLARSPAFAEEASAFLGEPVSCLGASGAIPFPDRSFDAVVVALDILSALPDDAAFIKECNRVLRPAGLLLLSVSARRAFSLVPAFRGGNAPSDPLLAAYTEPALCQLLKNGFDVDAIDGFSPFFTELVRIRALRMLRSGLGPDEIAPRLRRAFSAARFFDRFAFGSRRNVLSVLARRRQWSSRGSSSDAFVGGRSIGANVLFR